MTTLLSGTPPNRLIQQNNGWKDLKRHYLLFLRCPVFTPLRGMKYSTVTERFDGFFTGSFVYFILF